ncbi:MAG: Flp pilus assembly protein CpaB [Alphaproteobacteria bacterium]|nr:Flp pilus assembly protein CpaB [Alphaproteobacteria bacterium]
MNRNIVIVLIGGVLIAVLVAVLVQASLGGGAKKQEAVIVDALPKVQIVVAAKKLAMGTALNETNMKWQDWPKEAVFSGAIVRSGNKKVSDMIEGRLIRPVAEGEPIVKTALVDEKGNFMAALLKPGMRAVAVDMKAAGMAGGFIGPGDFVDVLLTYKSSIRYKGKNPVVDATIEKNIDKLATETIIENVRVLAVDQAAVRDEESVKVGKTVTLEVDQKGAEVLALAGEMGDLSLSLRRLGDNSVPSQKGPVTTDARLTNIFDEVYQEMVQVEKNSGQMADIVKIYNGASVQELPVSP